MSQRVPDVEAFSCFLCWNVLKDPVTTSCGHSYCSGCLSAHWDTEDGTYSCPQCGHGFSCRPVLSKSTALAALVEHLKKNVLTAPPADDCSAGAEDVSCDVCAQRKLKAVKSCLQCLASFCQSHLQTHYEAAVFQKHQLVAPSNKLQENVCSKHDRVKDMFCCTDQQLICSVCVDQHQGHHTVSAAAERNQRQQQMFNQLHQHLQLKQTNLEQLHQEAQDIRHSAHSALQSTGDNFREMALLLMRRHSEVEQQIHYEQHTQLRRVQELQDQLQQDVTELKMNISELNTLSLIKDHALFLMLCPSLSTEPQSTQSALLHSHRDFEDLTKNVTALRIRIKLSLEEALWTAPVEPKPETRAELLRYSTGLTWDINSVHQSIFLSGRSSRAAFTDRSPRYPEDPERFSHCPQVLSREALTGQCYWEVELNGKWSTVAMSYADILRKGDAPENRLGLNDKSWALVRKKGKYFFQSGSQKSKVPGPVSSKIGVYLDHSAGTLIFYSIHGQTMKLLHTVQTIFTQPLFAGVCFEYSLGASAQLLTTPQNPNDGLKKT